MKRLAGRFYIVLVLFAAYYFTLLWFELNYEFRGAPWRALLNGLAPTPFQYRVLILWLAPFLSKILTGGQKIASIYSMLFWIEFITVCLLTLAFRQYLSLFFRKRLAAILSFSLFLALPFNFLLNRTLALRYPSDLPAILLFTLGLILIYKKNWLLFYPLFIIATLNRETTCYLTVVYLCTSIGRERPKQIIIHILSQALIWVEIKYYLYHLYIANGGDAFWQTHLSENFNLLMTPRAYPQFLSNFGYLWIPTLAFWRIIPDQFVKRTVWLIPLFFLGMFFIGNMYELRIYGELIPVVLTAFLLILKELFRRDAEEGETE